MQTVLSRVIDAYQLQLVRDPVVLRILKIFHKRAIVCTMNYQAEQSSANAHRLDSLMRDIDDFLEMNHIDVGHFCEA